ncbi:hypothetical protein CLV51_102405 [Chitinophaga niastensis]|uniref:Uncharacterized protein n=1 Tax=Chitinophaga niastensis TaxID=536980 RepID=A0A2P8HMT9_CHINA|nr:hypothetical protein CLV51_102405 [Chitinophaga niastensis]
MIRTVNKKIVEKSPASLKKECLYLYTVLFPGIVSTRPLGSQTISDVSQ